jgi:peptidoglycan/LPS O-acetylase OafA/YrhL
LDSKTLDANKPDQNFLPEEVCSSGDCVDLNEPGLRLGSVRDGGSTARNPRQYSVQRDTSPTLSFRFDSATDRTKRKIPELDGVRGIAILIVIVHNTLPKFPSLPLQSLFAYGWMGVDLFFVLSGFLITGILLDSKGSEGYFKNFYARRILRIWPLYYSILLLMFVVVPFLRPASGSAIFARSSRWWAYPFFLQNFLIYHSSSAAGPLGVTWSLAIEEQFYLVWAVAIRWCSKFQLLCIGAAVICLSPGLRLYLSLHHADIYTNVFCRMDGLMEGGLLALALGSPRFLLSRLLNLAWLSLFAAASLGFLTETLHARWMTYSFVSIGSTAFVYLALFEAHKWLRAVLTNRWLIYTGTISYGLYLLHKIPFDFIQLFHWDKYPALAWMTGLAACYVIATLSWKLLEKPFLNLKRLFESNENIQVP